VKIQNLDRFKAKLRRLPQVAKDEIRKGLEQSADEIVDLMKRMVPVDEGDLQRSIGWTWGAPPEGASVFAQAAGEAGMVITIYAGDASTVVTNARGVEFQNALIQEFGRKGKHAQSFFRPAWRINRKRARSRISRSIGKAARKVAAGG